MIEEKAPVRISFCSAGDQEWYFEKTGWGNALSATINLYSWCRISGNAVEMEEDFPRESGLGGSSSSLVALLKAFDRKGGICRPRDDLALLTHAIERKWLGVPGGYQDQFASAFRGFNYYEFRPGPSVKVEPLDISRETIRKLEKSLVMAWLPRERPGSEVHADIRDNSAKTLEIVKEKRSLCLEARKAIISGDIGTLAEIAMKDTRLKKMQSPLIFTEAVEKAAGIAMKNSCLGYRLLGAGSGGCMLFFCGDRKRLIKSLDGTVRIIPFRFEVRENAGQDRRNKKA
jgi:D-glycero-alpha-D-manno-heptose-7-phosphate kinase